MRFQLKKALVTGAASGIGRATAQLFAAEGALVGVLDLNEVGAASVADEINGVSVGLDISRIDDVAAVVDSLVGDIGGLDILVNCAGWDVAQPFTATGPEFWTRVIGINLVGPIAVTHAALTHMPDGSAIVNVASDAGRVGSSGEVVYSGAKGGIIAFGKALARETARRQIRVNTVAPGPTDTPFFESFDESGKLADALIRQTPLRKLATPQDVASAVAYLASTEAGHITGQVLSVSGGLTMV